MGKPTAGAGSGQVASDWFDAMYEDVAGGGDILVHRVEPITRYLPRTRSCSRFAHARTLSTLAGSGVTMPTAVKRAPVAATSSYIASNQSLATCPEPAPRSEEH